MAVERTYPKATPVIPRKREIQKTMNAHQPKKYELLIRLKELDVKYTKAVAALEFIAFSNPDIWKAKDRMERAKKTLLALGEIEPVKREHPNDDQAHL
jgi:hypothetical protein